MFWFKQIVFLIVPGLQKNQEVSQNYYRMVIKDNQPGCVEAKISKNLAKRFNAHLGYCKDVGCNEYKGKQLIPFCCTVKGYGCNNFNYSKKLI